MRPLFQVYPALKRRIDGLCRGVPWCITGVSALLHYDGGFLFEITKPEYWSRREDGTLVAGIGAVGGSLEPGETLLACLQREALEEVRAPVQVDSAAATYLLYEEQLAASVVVPPVGEYSLPLLFTISQNLYRRRRFPEHGILTIVTYLARLTAAPSLGDLYGYLSLPAAALPAVLGRAEITIAELARAPGVRLETREAAPPELCLVPVWTGRSLQLLVRAGLTGALVGALEA